MLLSQRFVLSQRFGASHTKFVEVAAAVSSSVPWDPNVALEPAFAEAFQTCVEWAANTADGKKILLQRLDAVNPVTMSCSLGVQSGGTKCDGLWS